MIERIQIRVGDWKPYGSMFYLNLAAEVICNINSQVDPNSINSAKKSMVQSGLSLNHNGNWKLGEVLAQ